MALQTVRDFLTDELRIVASLHLDGFRPDRLRRVTGYFAAAADEMKDGPPERQHQLLSALLHRIVLHADSIRIDIKRTGLIDLLPEPDAATAAAGPEDLFSFAIPIQLRRRGVEAKLVMTAGGNRCPPADKKLVTLIAEAHRWIDDLAQGRAVSVRDLARLHHRDVGEVSRTLPLAFLTPDIVEAILGGRQPIDLTPRSLKRIGALPWRWDEQRRRLGFLP